jgi:hypothetical protein
VGPSRIAAVVFAGFVAVGLSVAVAQTPPAVGEVKPLPLPDGQQQIEVLRPGASQGLAEAEGIAQGEQNIGVPEPRSPAKRAASTAGKVALGVLAAAVAIAAGAASLLLL